MEIIPVNSSAQFEAIEEIAKIIIPEVYGGYVSAEHNAFFLEKFQTVKAIQEQISDGYEYFMIRDSGTDVGYFSIKAKGKILFLSKLYLLKECRGKGFGQKAMDRIIDSAKKLGKEKIELIVNRQNEGSVRFYQFYDFEITEHQVNSFENGYTVYDYKMTKII